MDKKSQSNPQIYWKSWIKKFFNVEFKKSKSSKIFYEGYTIKENQLSSIPIVTKRDLAKLYNVKYRQILGMGLNVNIPIHFSKMAKEIKGYLKGSKKSGTFSYPFPIEITYETIRKVIIH